MNFNKLFIFFFIIYSQILNAQEVNSDNLCKWENESSIPCLEIKSSVTNISKHSKSGLNKTVITKKQIEKTGAIDIIDVLKIVPEINITQSGPKGQQASIFMRGTGSNHTLVMINGIPINDQSTTQGLHDFGVDFIQTIQQIEIYPGSSGTHFGTNAIGGAINIILTGDYKNNFSISNDNKNNYELAANKTLIFNNSSLNFKLGSVASNKTSARGKIKDEKDDLKNYSANINYEKYFNNLRFYNTTYLRQTKAEYDNSSSDQFGYEGDNKMGSFQLGLENFNQEDKSNYILYYNIYDRKYDEKGTIDKYESEVVGLKYDFSKTIFQNISFGIGSEYKYDWGYFDNKGSYQSSTKGNSDNLGLYGNLGLNISNSSNISLFTRSDKHSQTGLNNSFKINFEKDYKMFNNGIAYMTGLRNPTLFELFGSDNYGYSGNKNLKAEKSNTREIYSNINLTPKTIFSLRAYATSIEDNIEYINNKYRNDGDDVNLHQSGLNLNLLFKSKNSNLNIFSSFQSSKKEDRSNQLRRPNKNYGISLFKKFNNDYLREYNLNLIYNHYGKHLDTNSINFSTVEMDSTDLLDLKINRKFNNANFFLKITNLLDETYQRPHGYNQDGRNIKFGFNF